MNIIYERMSVVVVRNVNFAMYYINSFRYTHKPTLHTLLKIDPDGSLVQQNGHGIKTFETMSNLRRHFHFVTRLHRDHTH